MAEYDLPAIIDYVLEKTKQKSLYYVAHSQGATVGFEAFSENKTLAKKVKFNKLIKMFELTLRKIEFY